MQLIKSIILSIFSSITNTLPISYSSHITLYKEVFNTNMFDNSALLSLLNISTVLAIFILYYKDFLFFIKKIITLKKTKNKPLYKQNTKYIKFYISISILSGITYLIFHSRTTNLKRIAFSYIITAFLLFLSTNKKGEYNHTHLTCKSAIFLGISPILTIIPSLSPLSAYLFTSSRLHLNKKTALTLSLLCTIPILLLNSIPGLIYIINEQTYVISSLLSIVIATFISLQIVKYLKNLYNQNKLYKFSLYCIFISLFILIWFR